MGLWIICPRIALRTHRRDHRDREIVTTVVRQTISFVIVPNGLDPVMRETPRVVVEVPVRVDVVDLGADRVGYPRRHRCYLR